MKKLIFIFLAVLLLLCVPMVAAAEDTEIGVYARVVLSDATAPLENGAGSITLPDGTVIAVTDAPENALTLVVIPMEGEALAWIDGLVDGETEAAYDIHFRDAQGNRINANGAKVSITVSGSGLTVTSVTPSGTKKSLSSSVSGGKISFTTDGSHYYAIAAHSHSFTDRVSDVKAADATCTEPAKYYVRCDKCAEYTKGKTVSVGDPLGHDWDEGTVTTKPTCEKEGVRTFTCKRDSSHTYTKAEPAAGHSFTKYVSDKNATCKKNGTETAVCDNGCGKTHTRTDKDSKLGHTFVDGKCIRCELSWWIPETGDMILIAGAVMILSGVALLLLLAWKKKKQNR